MTRRTADHEHDRPAANGPTRCAGPWVAGGLALTAFLLRAWHVDHGLPDFHDEAHPFRVALDMWGWREGRLDLNPAFFHYPTLTVYLHLLLQKIWYAVGAAAGRFTTPADYWLLLQTDPTGPVVAARLVGVVADAVSVVLAWRLAERLRAGSGWLAAAVVALAATLIVTSREIYVDPVQAVLALAAAERMTAWLADGGRGRLAAAVVCVGLAAGAKYNAGLLVVPLAWVVARREGRRALWLAPVLAAACLAVFLLTSPFVALDFPSFWRDFTFEREHMAVGHLGALGTRGGGYLLDTAVGHLGAPLIVALVGGLATLPRRRPRAAEITVWLVLVPPLLAVALFRMTATRYLVPLVAPAAVLAAVATVAGARWAARRLGRRSGPVLAVAGLLVLAPVGWAGLRAAAAGADTTRSAARRWLEVNLRAGDVVLQESYGASLRNAFEDRSVMREPFFAATGTAARAAFFAPPRFRATSLPLLASGDIHVDVDMGGGRRKRVTVFPHGSQLNAPFYRPRLLEGVDVFVKSAGVATRYESDPARYPGQNAFYQWLADHAEVAARFPATASCSGPGIVVYRLGPRAREEIQRLEPLDPLWWTETVPRSFRTEADTLLAPPSGRSGGAVRLADGRLAPWVKAISWVFEQFIMPTNAHLAWFLEESGRHRAAFGRAGAVLVMAPDHELVAIAYARAARALGEFEPALEALRRVRTALEQRGEAAADLLLEEARVLAAAGRSDEARAVCRQAVARAPTDADLARWASQLVRELDAQP